MMLPYAKIGVQMRLWRGKQFCQRPAEARWRGGPSPCTNWQSERLNDRPTDRLMTTAGCLPVLSLCYLHPRQVAVGPDRTRERVASIAVHGCEWGKCNIILCTIRTANSPSIGMERGRSRPRNNRSIVGASKCVGEWKNSRPVSTEVNRDVVEPWEIAWEERDGNARTTSRKTIHVTLTILNPTATNRVLIGVRLWFSSANSKLT